MPHSCRSFIASALFLAVVPAALAQTATPNIPAWPGSSTPTQPASAPQPTNTQQPAPAAIPAPVKAKKLKQTKEEKQAADDTKEKANTITTQQVAMASTLDADGKPIVLAPCAKKDKECIQKRKELLKRKTLAMKIENGTLTVDGWTGKARLNYDISEVKFLFFWAPGVGTVIVSTERFPNSFEQKTAFDKNTLSVSTPDGHTLQLNSEKPLLGKHKEQGAWVSVDSGYNLNTRYPAFGYGSVARAPYNWPGARPASEDQQKLTAKAPPLPRGMEAKQMVLPCQKVAPGQQPTPVKINGVMMTPPVCPPTPATAAGKLPPAAQESSLTPQQ